MQKINFRFVIILFLIKSIENNNNNIFIIKYSLKQRYDYELTLGKNLMHKKDKSLYKVIRDLFDQGDKFLI